VTDPYASHLPILKFVLALVKPKEVLELGAGKYSTAEFLACESVERLTSLETNPEWASTVSMATGDDRLDLWTVEDIPAVLPDLRKFDLVFIDNGNDATERSAAIRAVLSRPHPVTVIHDAEVYAGVIHELAENRITFNFDTPYTAVCW
jgi:predicted O-methyltransferase YrrM